MNEERSQEHSTGKRACRFQKKITFWRIALLSEKLQEFRSCRSYRIKNRNRAQGPDFLRPWCFWRSGFWLGGSMASF
jgi:hypothetical protein